MPPIINRSGRDAEHDHSGQDRLERGKAEPAVEMISSALDAPEKGTIWENHIRWRVRASRNQNPLYVPAIP